MRVDEEEAPLLVAAAIKGDRRPPSWRCLLCTDVSSNKWNTEPDIHPSHAIILYNKKKRTEPVQPDLTSREKPVKLSVSCYLKDSDIGIDNGY